MKRLIGLMAAVGLLLMLAMPVAAGNHETGGGDKVTLCHATNSASNPYVAIQVDASGNVEGHKADGGDFHINEKTLLQDFLLAESDLETCDEFEDVPVTPLAPTVSAPTCPAPGILTLTAVEGVVYTITPDYTAGVSFGEFTVTAAADADAGFTLAPGATTTFNVTVPARLNCVTPLAPSVSATSCPGAGVLTLNAVNGVVYTVSPAYTVGASGAFTVTATAAAGFTLAPGATTTFNVTVPAQLNCVTALAPSVSAASCPAAGVLTLNAVNGVVYTVSPAYTAGASGTFTVTATAASGFTLTGPSVFVVNVPAQLVCSSGTLESTSTPPAPPVRSGTLTSTGVPNTATLSDSTELPTAALIGLLLLFTATLGALTQPSMRARTRHW